MKSIQLKSGNTLNFQLAPIKDAIQLFRAVVSSFATRGIELKLDRETEINIGQIFLDNSKAFLGGLSDVICNEQVEEILLRLANGCNYECRGRKERITMDTFEDVEARCDYFEILFHVAKENLTPFFASLHTR